MATTTNLSSLVINYLTQAQYDAAAQAGTLNENQLYLTPAEEVITSETDPIFMASAAAEITSTDINTWNQAEPNVQVDWAQTTTTADDYIKNKPSIPSIFTTSKTLQVANWSSNTQTVSISAVTTSSTVIVSPIPTSIDDYTVAGIRCTGQASGTLTFTCTTTPSNIVYINVIVIN